jgi:hypothetical protein
MEEERDGGDVQYAEDEEGIGGIEMQIGIHPVRGRPMSSSIFPLHGSLLGRHENEDEDDWTDRQNKEWMSRWTDDWWNDANNFILCVDYDKDEEAGDADDPATRRKVPRRYIGFEDRQTFVHGNVDHHELYAGNLQRWKGPVRERERERERERATLDRNSIRENASHCLSFLLFTWTVAFTLQSLREPTKQLEEDKGE